MDAEVLVIAENPLLSDEEKRQATLRVKGVYRQVCQSKFVSSTSRGFRELGQHGTESGHFLGLDT